MKIGGAGTSSVGASTTASAFAFDPWIIVDQAVSAFDPVSVTMISLSMRSHCKYTCIIHNHCG